MEKTQYIVGIGASAGGLEAIQDFFDHMPANTGMAFVVIQHLSPEFKSLMDQLLKRNTEMNIRPVTDKMAIEPNTIYLIPPKHNMTIKEGLLCLTEQIRGHHLNLPVDIFFESLARECQIHAIGIILSGTGSDGSKGLIELSRRGGLVIVQDPDTAKFDGMPRNAIATKHVRCILDVLQMPKAIIDYASSPNSFNEQKYTTQINYHSSVYDYIFELLRDKFKIDFNFYKPTTISRRIDRRAKNLSLESLVDFKELLENSEEQLELLYKDLLIGVTAFFRDPEAFDILNSQVIVPLVQNRKNSNKEIRVWVAACSTGEEAYSIAILLKEALKHSDFVGEVKVFASDVSTDFLATANQGKYENGALSAMPDHLLSSYFIKVDDHHYQITPEIRRMVVFAKHNILSDAPFTKMDLVSCRNFLIYVQPGIQQKILNLLRFALKRKGALFLGPSETIADVEHDFEIIDSSWKIFRKVLETKREIDFSLPDKKNYNTRLSALPNSTELNLMHKNTAVDTFAYDYLLDTFIPDGILINENHEIIYVFGGSNEFLSYPSGRAKHDILSAISTELKPSLSTALHKSRYNNEIVCYTDIEYTLNKKKRKVKLTVSPITNERGKIRYLLVQLAFLRARKKEVIIEKSYAPSDEHNEIVKGLEEELKFTKESLQATIEEVETTNEELQSTNEELLASNEELQSTNEELHSVNEELYTVNTEYQKKIEELTQTNNDIDNFLRSTNIGTIFLDKHLNIRLYTPASAKIFDLSSNDLGRPLKSFSHNIVLVNLDEVIETVVKSSEAIISEVQLKSGQWYLMQVLPYLNQNQVQDGIILTFMNVDEVRKAHQTIEFNEKRYKTLIENSSSFIWSATIDGKFEELNEHWLNYTGQSFSQAQGYGWLKSFFESDYQFLKEKWHQCIRDKTPLQEILRLWSKEHQAYRYVRLMAAPLVGQDGTIYEWTGSLTDVHYEKEADAKLNTAFQASPIAMLLINKEGTIQFINKPTEELFGYHSQELMSQSIEIFVPQKARANHRLHRREYLKNPIKRPMGSGTDFIAVRKDGSEFPVEVTLTPVPMIDGDYILCSVLDITTRKKAEDILKNTNEILEQKVAERTKELQREKKKRLASEKLFTENKAMYEDILDATTDGWWDWNLETNDEYLSPKFKSVLGYRDQELPNKAESWQKIIYPEDLDLALKAFENHIKFGEPFEPTVRYYCKNGETKWIWCRGKAIVDEDSKQRRMIGTHTDLSTLKKTEFDLERKVLELTFIYKAISIAQEASSEVEALHDCLSLICELIGWDIGHVFITDYENKKFMSQATWFFSNEEKSLKFKKATQNATFYFGDGLPGKVMDAKRPLWIEDINEEPSFIRRYLNKQDTNIRAACALPVIVSGQVVAVCEFFKFKPAKTDPELIRAFGLLGRQLGNVFEKKISEKQLNELANYDEITNLPNRNYFKDALARMLSKAKRTNEILALLFCDLDDFKIVNDTKGHSAGDLVLKESAARLKNSVREGDFVARIGGDEFVIILENLYSSGEIDEFAKRIINAFSEPFIVGDSHVQISVSIGVSLYPYAGETAASLIKNADIAMYSAKENGKNVFEFYTKKLNQEKERRLIIERDLHSALHNDELYLDYQPIYNLKDSQMVGLEALLRWNHPLLGNIPPLEFISIAEATGAIREITEWVFETSIRQLEEINKQSKRQHALTINLSINFSAKQLVDNEVLAYIKSSKDVLSKNIPIVIEVTESSLVQNFDVAKSILEDLKQYGFKIAIDDFGTGYSSLEYLQKLEVDIIKVDRSFVDAIESNCNKPLLVKAIIEMADSLGNDIIIEGIETERQLDYLEQDKFKTLKVSLWGQGYHLCRPIGFEELLILLNG